MVVLAVMVVSQTPEGSITRHLLLERAQGANKEAVLRNGQGRPIGTLGNDAGCNSFTVDGIPGTASSGMTSTWRRMSNRSLGFP